MITSGIALIYQKITATETSNIVRCHIDDYVEGTDEFDHKAKAERYYKNDPSLIGHKIVAWHHILAEDVDG